MNITITQSQAILINNSLNMMKSYMKELHMNNDILSSKEWKDIDNIIQQIKGGN